MTPTPVDPVGETRPLDLTAIEQHMSQLWSLPERNDIVKSLIAEVVTLRQQHEALQRQVDAVRALIDPASEMAYAGIFGTGDLSTLLHMVRNGEL